MIACVATPISWLRLEQFAATRADAQVSAHVAACPACAQCLAEIERDVVALPPLAVPAPRRRSIRWWQFAVPALALAAAALLFVIWPRDAVREDAVTVKGIGEVILGTVRERDGVITSDATTFLPGDRFKIVVTCPPAASAWLELDVDGDRPLPATQIACGNRVVVPGAFHLTGTAPNRICVRVATTTPDASAPRACVTVNAE